MLMGSDEEPERSTEPADDRSLVPEPATDEATVELIRDAVGVARCELSDETFFEKYGVGTGDGQVGDE